MYFTIMKNITIMDNLPVDVSNDRIYMRLGKSRPFAKITDVQKLRIDRVIADAKRLCKPVGAWEIVQILDNNGKIVQMENGDALVSGKLAEILNDCSHVLLFAVTVGAEIGEAANQAAAEGCLADAVIFDATGSETADGAAKWIQDYLRQYLRPQGMLVETRRFSPGYGGFELSQQELFFRRLELVKLGMSINEAYIISPEKSVTAVCGITRL